MNKNLCCEKCGTQLTDQQFQIPCNFCPCHSKDEKEKCKHCGGDLAIRNPKGYCDHLCYPDNCEVCHSKDVEEKVEICGKDIRDDEGFLMAVCHKPKGLCHHFPKDDGLERVLEEFDKKYLTGELFIEDTVVDGVPLEPIKKFITQVYKEAYAKGEKEGQARMNNSGRLLFQQGVESERERIRKELPKEKPIRKYYPSGGGVMEEHIEWNDCLNQVKKII